MRDVIATYRGYPVHLSLGVNWSFTATPLTPDRPILARAEWGNWHAELGADGKDYRADSIRRLVNGRHTGLCRRLADNSRGD
jgi:hypothetical protein